MGNVIDYFKPVPGITYCEMLQSRTLHQWSSDGKNWKIPIPNGGSTGGGSAPNYPTDGRRYLSFWGGNGANGGCCHYTYNDGAAWNKAFRIYYATGIKFFLVLSNVYFTIIPFLNRPI